MRLPAHSKAIAIGFAALAAGCSARNVSSMPPADQTSSINRSVAGTVKPVLFVSDLDKRVLMYPSSLQQQNPMPLGQLTVGVTRSVGVAADAAGNLYVSNNGGGAATIDIYRQGTTYPIRSITRGLVTPGMLAVDAKGTIYVGDQNPSDQHVALLVYPRGATAPSRRVELPLTGYAAASSGVALDANGNVLEGLVLPEHNAYHVFSITPGVWKPVDLGLRQLGGAAVAADGSGNLYVANNAGGIQFYPAGSTSPARFLSAPGAEFFGGIAVTKNGTVYAPAYNGSMYEFAPGAVSPTNTFALEGGGFDAAVTPW